MNQTIEALTVLKIGYLVGRLIGWIVVLAATAGAAEPFRFEPSDRIEPIPETRLPPALPENPEPASAGDPDGRTAVTPGPADARPLVYLYLDPVPGRCGACVLVERMLASGELPEFRVEARTPPPWVHVYPTFHFSDPTGRKWYRYPGTVEEWDGVQGFRRKFAQVNPEPLPAAAMTGAPLADQLSKYLPDGTRLTIDLPRPMTVTTDDGSTLIYSRVTGRLSTVGGKPTLTLEPPLPTVSARKWFMRFGATINAAEWNETTPPSVGITTSRGKFVVELREIP